MATYRNGNVSKSGDVDEVKRKLILPTSDPTRLLEVELKPWSIYSSSQNLVSVLHDPTVSRNYSETIFTKDWGSGFIDDTALTTESKVNVELFRNYLKYLLKRKRCIKNFTLISQAKKLSNNSHTKTKLESVPKHFLENDFNLEERNLFFSVFFPKDVQVSDNKLTIGSVREIQKTLSDYLDIIEEHLSSQISSRFRDFFHIMNAMDMVMDQISKTIREVTLVRSRCQLLSKTLIEPTMKNLYLHHKKQNTLLCYAKIKHMHDVFQYQASFNALLAVKNYVGALDVCQQSRSVVNSELKGIQCFHHLANEITEREKLVEAFLIEDYSKYLTTEWHKPLGLLPEKLNDEDGLISILYGFLRLNNYFFIEKFKEEACATITTFAKQILIEALSKEDTIDINDRLEESLFDKTRQLSYAKWFVLVQQLFEKILYVLKRFDSVYSVILGSFDSFITNQEINKTQKEDFLAKKSSLLTKSLLRDICDFAHEKCTLLIVCKVNDGSLDKILALEFTQLTFYIDAFIENCEKISGHRSASLKNFIALQSTKFAARFHEERRKKLSSLLHIEQWKSIENISADFQELLTQIQEGNIGSMKKERNNIAVKGGPHVTFGGEKYTIVNSVQTMIMMLTEYCQMAEKVGLLVSELLLKIFELLKQFNSNVYNLLCKGDAIHLAGLKCITARNLANSIMALRLVNDIIPYVKKHFESLLPSDQSHKISEFDEISKLLSEHQVETNEKLVNMAREQITGHLSKWEAKPPVPSPQFLAVKQYLEVLHSNLEDCLSQKSLLNLFVNIHEAFKNVLKAHLIRLKIVKDGGPQHGLVTQELIFYSQSLNKRFAASRIKFSNDDLWP